MQSSDIVWFKSKVDWSIRLILAFVPLLQLGIGVQAFLQGDAEGVRATLLGMSIVVAIYVGLVIPVRYGIAEDALLVHFGLVRQRIRYGAIREVYPSRSLLSSPALSFDRLAIKTGKGPLHLTLISPIRREEFIDLLADRAQLTWDGVRWMPSSEFGGANDR